MRSPADPRVEVTFQAEVTLPETVTVDAVTSLVRYILHAEGVDDDWQMGIRFVDDETMQAAHVEFMDIDAPTDIMTFPYEDADDDFGPEMVGTGPEPVAGGDLIISVDRAADHAMSAGWGVDQEVLFLIAHGVLHLVGWDDATDEERSAMLDRQSQLLSEWRESPSARY
jgi:probable rRNA maturation factor